MAKDRITPCIYYICAGKCEKGRGAEHKGYCQKCDQYRPVSANVISTRRRERLRR